MRKWKLSVVVVMVLLGAIALASCASNRLSDESRVFYLCEGGYGFDVEIVQGGEVAVVNYGSKTVTLQRIKSSADRSYGNGELTFHLTGKEGSFLEKDGKAIMKNCKVERSW